MSGTNHWCAVPRCFSQLGMWGDERCSAANRVKTTDANLPRRESGTMRKRIKGFPSVLFFNVSSYTGTILGIVLGLPVPCCSCQAVPSLTTHTVLSGEAAITF